MGSFVQTLWFGRNFSWKRRCIYLRMLLQIYFFIHLWVWNIIIVHRRYHKSQRKLSNCQNWLVKCILLGRNDLTLKKNGKISCTKAKTDLHGGTIFKHKVIKLRGKLSPVISGAFWPQAGTRLLRKLSSHLAWNTHKKTYRGAIRTAARKKIAKIVFRHFFVLEVRCFDYRPHLVSDFFPLLFCVIIPVTPNFDFYEKKPSLCY